MTLHGPPKESNAKTATVLSSEVREDVAAMFLLRVGGLVAGVAAPPCTTEIRFALQRGALSRLPALRLWMFGLTFGWFCSLQVRESNVYLNGGPKKRKVQDLFCNVEYFKDEVRSSCTTPP